MPFLPRVLVLSCVCVAAVFLTNRLLLMLLSHCFLGVGVWLPVIHHLSFFTFLLACLILVLFHWGFGLCVCLCSSPSWPCCFPESQPPALCTFHATFLSLHRRGGLFGTSWESECSVRLQFCTRGVAAATLAAAGACWGFCLIRIKDQPVIYPVEQYLLGPLLVDKVCVLSAKILILLDIIVLFLVSSPSFMWWFFCWSAL